MNWLAVALGGAVGSMFRYWVSTGIGHRWPVGFPWGTIVVNGVGSLLIGFCYVIIEQRFPGNELIRTLVIVGLLGGFTTFSAFSIETVQLFQSGLVGRAAGNVIASFALCILASIVGIQIGRWVIAT